MIVLDEQLQDPEIADGIRGWHRRVIGIQELRPHSVVKDEAIPSLLKTRRGCAFVTINWSDFWRILPPRRAYAVICMRLLQDQATRVPTLLRRLWRSRPFGTRRGRCGKVFLLSDEGYQFYERLGEESRLVSWTAG